MFLLFSLFTLTYSCVDRSSCHNQGDCLNGECVCDDGYKGNSCHEYDCLYGQKSKDRCVCDYGSKEVGGVCTKSCQHGNFSIESGECRCNIGWKTAGITDTVNWFKGTCNQYQCKSNLRCAELLPHIPNPTCPIKGWNCDCGFRYLGYSDEKAGCMSFMYWLSIKSFRLYRYLCLKVIWKIFLILGVVSLPFGRKRPFCDHHRSWMAVLKRQLGYDTSCDGSCIRKKRWCIRDDLALSLYWMKSCIWWYLFLTILLGIFGFLWSFVLWLMVLVTLLVIGIIICVAAVCGGGGDSNGGAECLDCLNCSDCNCCNCSYSSNGNNTNVYILGPYPDYYNGYYYGGCDSCNRCNSCNCGCRCCLFEPLYALSRWYPYFPENLHGGVVGYCMQTHITNNRYIGGSRIVDFMSLNWRRHYDLRDHDNWRGQVVSIINPGYSSLEANKMTRDYNMSFSNHIRDNILEGEREDRNGLSIIRYPYRVPSSKRVINRDHVEENECWICNDVPGKWQLWSCGHIICEDCGDQWLEREGTCVLCRMAPGYISVYEN